MRYLTWRKFILPFAILVCGFIYLAGPIGCGGDVDPNLIVKNYLGNMTGTGNTQGSLDFTTTEGELLTKNSLFSIKEALAQTTASVTGSILVGGVTIDVDTGELNVNNGEITFTAGDYEFNGTLVDGVFTGTWTNVVAGTVGVWSALESTSVAVTSYCGTYTSDVPAPGVEAGVITFQVSDNGKAAGTFTSNTNPDLVNIPFTGTVTNGTNLTLNGTGGLGSATAVIDTNAGTADGTWEVNIPGPPPVTFSGTFNAGTATCN